MSIKEITPKSGKPIQLTLSFKGIVSYRAYLCTEKDGQWRVSEKIDENGKAWDFRADVWNLPPLNGGEKKLLFIPATFETALGKGDVSLTAVLTQDDRFTESETISAQVSNGESPSLALRLFMRGV